MDVPLAGQELRVPLQWVWKTKATPALDMGMVVNSSQKHSNRNRDGILLFTQDNFCCGAHQTNYAIHWCDGTVFGHDYCFLIVRFCARSIAGRWRY
ncbi:MAG: hypothetical protein ACJAU3_000215 [Zhongshania sp.]